MLVQFLLARELPVFLPQDLPFFGCEFCQTLDIIDRCVAGLALVEPLHTGKLDFSMVVELAHVGPADL